MTEDRKRESDQLRLDLAPAPGGDDPVLPSRLSLPLATDGHGPFDDEGYFFEPWWPGAHATLTRERGQLALRTEHLADPLEAFPELAGIDHSLRGNGLIIEGVLLALDTDGRPDPRLLRQRLAGAGSPDGAAEGAFVATDLPYLEGRSLARLPFVERRRRLGSVLIDSARCVLGRGVTGEGRVLGRAAAALGLPAISARRLDARWKGGPAGDAWLRLPVTAPRGGQATPFLVLLERLPFDA